MATTVYGSSDDIVCADGDIYGEGYPNSDGQAVLACSDGTIAIIYYDQMGMWKILIKRHGDLLDRLESGTDPDSNYTDRLHFQEGLKFIYCNGKLIN